MQIDLLGYSDEPIWYDYKPGGRFKIGFYPAYERAITLSSEQVVTVPGSEQLKRYNLCLLDWDGLVDQNNKPIPFSKDIKDQFAKYNTNGIFSFVVNITYSRDLEAQKISGELEKN